MQTSAEDDATKLKAACFNYYTTQQLISRAEDEHLQLRAIEQQLLHRIDECRKERDRLRQAATEIDEERAKEAALPPGMPVAAFDAFVAEESRLLKQAADANDAIEEYQREIQSLDNELAREVQSARLLEEALDSQCAFGNVLIATTGLGNKRVDAERHKQAASAARLHWLRRQLTELKKRETMLAKKLRFAESSRNQIQGVLGEREGDAVRLRRDATFVRRLHLAELEHAREQETELHRLTDENRRLRGMVEARREGRPTLRKSNEVTSKGVMSTQPMTQRAQVINAQGIAQDIVVESTDEVENFGRRAGALGSGKLVEAHREMNLALLQQMVASMQALRVAVQPAPA